MREIIKEWQGTVFQSVDLMFVFLGITLILKTLFEEGVLA